MSDTVTFTPNIAGPLQFQGRGSKIEYPDLQPIFWGPYWPSSAGPVSVSAIMDAIRTVANGPYLDRLRQYGYVGPVKVRDPIVDPSGAGLPNAVTNYVRSLVDDDRIDDVDDNHELMTFVFLDPSIPAPLPVTGGNTSIDDPNPLDDATRFEIIWVACDQSFSQITQTFTHELAEAITDPFNTGWVQTTPQPSPNQGQVCDVCNQQALVNGVSVVAYFSQADGLCVVPLAGDRKILSLTYTLDVHEPHKGPQQQAFVDLGRPLCAAGYFDFTQVTYRNEITVRMKIQGYESPLIEWRINGTPLGILNATVEVPATWHAVPAHRSGPHRRKNTASVAARVLSNQATEIKLFCGPNEGNTSFQLEVRIRESFDLPGGTQNTLHTGIIDFDLVNQEIEWSDAYKAAKKNCQRLQHLMDGPDLVIGPPQPGDPPGLLNLVTRALKDHTSERPALLQRAADAMRQTRPRLAEALADLANRSR